jgi:hypothetical protein
MNAIQAMENAARELREYHEHDNEAFPCPGPLFCPGAKAIYDLETAIAEMKMLTAPPFVQIKELEKLLAESSKMKNEGTKQWRYDEARSVVWNGAGGGAAHHVTKSAGKLIESMRNALPSLIAIAKANGATTADNQSEATYPEMKIEDLDSDTAHAILRAQGGI